MVNKSGIPIIGLVHRVDIVRKEDADDGAGGIIPEGAESSIYSKRLARVTAMSDVESAQVFGQASGETWKVLVEYSPDIQRQDFLRLASGVTQNAPIPSSQDYRIIFVRQQSDWTGGYHHTTLTVEKEDTD
jgi:hypothetical protein